VELTPANTTVCNAIRRGATTAKEFTSGKAPNDRVLTILLTSILAGQREIRNELDSLPAKIKDFCTSATPSNR